MYYAPHKLYKRVFREERDEYGRITEAAESMVYVCECRCDDNGTQEAVDENGKVYIPKYHIVYPRSEEVKAGDYIVVKDGERVRGEGVASIPKNTNYYQYTEIWV